jgi:hypothetical protein
MPASQYQYDSLAPGVVSDINALVMLVTSNIIQSPCWQGVVERKEKIRTADYFLLKKWPKTERGLDLGADRSGSRRYITVALFLVRPCNS